MKPLDSYAYIRIILEMMKATTREQVTIKELEEVKENIATLVSMYEQNGEALQIITDLFSAIDMIIKANLKVVPNEAKQVIVSKLNTLKSIYLRELINQFEITEFEFEPGDETFHLLKDAVTEFHATN